MRRTRRQQSIKRRVVRLVLVPGTVALVLWIVASGYLVFQGFYNRVVADSVRQVSIPAVSALASIQHERRLSIAFLARPSSDLQELLAQRQQTDRLTTELRAAAGAALSNAPDSIVSGWTELTDYLDQLPGVRSTIDARSASEQRAYDFYNRLLDAATKLFDIQARVVPDVTATQGGIAATEFFRLSDLMSRSGSIIEGAFGSATFGRAKYLEFVRLVNAYHVGIDNVTPHLQDSVRQRLGDLTASDSWKDLRAAEDALIVAGVWRKGVPGGLSVSRDRWGALARQISGDLIGLTVAQADEVSAAALRTGNTQLLVAVLGSVIALAVVVCTILWAVRQSQVLVDRALSVRLARLGAEAAMVVDTRLPAMLERLRRREPVEVAAELPAADYGSDEIGQVARVINRSVQAAVGAAVDEAKTRAAGLALLMGVARRPQRPLQRGLKVVEDLQDLASDEKLLTKLFDINHQLTQTRRFLENLIILAGGQIGRRFPNPLPLRRVLLAAFAETRDYQRVQMRSGSEVVLAGQAVAGTIHLLAELLDNALAFSSPESTVWVTCRRVNHGVAVEIEDAGVGMTPAALERANELLATAPTPDVTSLKDGAQVGLYVVAELAKRDGTLVSLRKSAYGGLLAIVLLSERMLAGDPARGEPTGMNGGERPPAVPGRAPSPADPSRREPRSVGTAVVAAPNRSSVGLLGTGLVMENPLVPAGNEPGDDHGARGVGVPPPSPPSTAGSGSVPEAPDGSSAEASAQVASPPPLPHRRPQQHLAPGLRAASPPTPATPASTTHPEETRDGSRFVQYRQRWSDGRMAASREEPVTGADQGRDS